MFDLTKFRGREKPEKYVKLEESNNSSNVVHSRRRKLYEYYKCDCCNTEIRLDIKEWQRKTGGVTTLPHTLTNCGNITVALCNKCFNKVIKELER